MKLLTWVNNAMMGNQKKLSTKRKSLKLSKTDKILGQIVPLAPEKDFDYPVALYHLTDGH